MQDSAERPFSRSWFSRATGWDLWEPVFRLLILVWFGWALAPSPAPAARSGRTRRGFSARHAQANAPFGRLTVVRAVCLAAWLALLLLGWGDSIRGARVCKVRLGVERVWLRADVQAAGE